MEVNNPAGFWIRLCASIVDSLILFMVIGLISLAVYDQFYIGSFTFIDMLSPLYYLIVPVIWYGYTLGKRALGIRIARVDGEKVGIGTMLLRDLVTGIIYSVTFGIGVIVSAFMVGIREDKRSIHDFIAGTFVTYDPPEK